MEECSSTLAYDSDTECFTTVPCSPDTPLSSEDEACFVFGNATFDDDEGKPTTGSNDAGEIRFSPPVYRQRYDIVEALIAKYEHGFVRKVLDIGCAEGSLVQRLQTSTLHVQHIYGLDICRNSLKKAATLLKPEGLNRSTLPEGRKRPLRVSLLRGSATEFDGRLADVDAVLMIEVIEHMSIEDATKMANIVLGQIQPFVCVISTPNADYNINFDLPPGKFRHWDHRYEMSNEQFQVWCDALAEEHAEYCWKRADVGALRGVPGYSTQVAIFMQDQSAYCDTLHDRAAAARNVDDSLYKHKTVRAYRYQTRLEATCRRLELVARVRQLCSELGRDVTDIDDARLEHYNCAYGLSMSHAEIYDKIRLREEFSNVTQDEIVDALLDSRMELTQNGCIFVPLFFDVDYPSDDDDVEEENDV